MLQTVAETVEMFDAQAHAVFDISLQASLEADDVADDLDDVASLSELSAPIPASGADDIKIVALVPSVDVAALYDQHRVHLLRFVQRYVNNQDDAEDVVQNTFVEAVRCAERYSGLSKPSTWLFGIALNLARNHVRRSCADRYEMVDDDFMDELLDEHADPATLFEMRQIATKVEALLGELPIKIRSTFEAVLDGDVTYEEAAIQLNIPTGTVRSRVSRVRAAARIECNR